jgi:hypothetical protein
MANRYEVIDIWPDAHCGDHYAGAPRIGPAGWRWDSGTLYGNRLVNASNYYGAVKGAFNADGHQQGFVMGQLESSRFACKPKTANCKFP